MLYAIGDIHGCLDKLQVAVSLIKGHAGIRPYKVIFLGDYVDRGPDSRRCVNLIRGLVNSSAGTKDSGQGTFGTWHAIKGNHDYMMTQAAILGLDHPDTAMWLRNGGEETIKSYGANNHGDMQSHVSWFMKLPTHFETEKHFFVHAGVSSRYPLSDQPESVKLWHRGWAKDDYDFGKHIVYGHTPNLKGIWRYEHSTGLDTGAVYGGPLTVGVFDEQQGGGPVELLEAK